MKKILLLGAILLNSYFLSAQHIQIQKEKAQLYITHKVAAKETLYSLGRMYHLTPKEISTANKLSANAGLRVGQQIKIPLKKDNFLQTTPKKSKGLEPVYHTIKKGDNLYKLSKNYNNVKEADLKKWNKLSKAIVKPGQQIIVGYLKIDVSTRHDDVAAKPKAKIDSSKSVINKPEPQTTTQEAITYAEPPVKTQKELVVATAPEQTNVVTPTSQTASDESYFAANYSINAANAQEKIITGTAATFKSTSGWSDKKYYLLINDIAPETIVKVTVNGKSVYAKVLENLPDLKDNKGLTCRLSNAAASALGITDPKFAVEISFYDR